MKIGVLGATGPAGRGLAARLSDVGYDVLAGSRERVKAEAVLAELTERWGDRVSRITPANNQAACDADVVVLAVHADAALATAKYFADQLAGKIVVSMANHLERNGTEFNAVLPPHGSIAKEMQALLWRSEVVTAFHLVPAAELENLDHKMESDVVACGNDDDRPSHAHGDHLRDPGPARVRRRLPGERGRDGDVRGGPAHDQHPAQGEGRPAALGHLMALRLYDTAQRAVVPFEADGLVRMYVCGITPYDSTHLGHAATYLTYDLLIRRLEDLGHEVHMVRNVTDVDDSILPKARELGVPYLELAEQEIARFRADMDALEMRPPIAEPRATETIDEIISMVERLLDSGHAYLTHGTAYFDVSTAPHWGELSALLRGPDGPPRPARGGNPDDPHRRNPLDFVLWQPSAADEPAWRAPFGVGRPGWHVECSAMSMQELGPTLDLHGGGTDLIFPHHECEIAQSEAITGLPFVRHWLHSAMVAYEGEKMSKSLGNLVFISDLRQTADPRAIRLALLHHHYRSGFEWHDTDIQDGTALLHRLVAAARPTGRAGPGAVRGSGCGTRSTTTSTRPVRSTRSASSPTPILSGGTDPTAPAVLTELAALIGVDITRPL